MRGEPPAPEIHIEGGPFDAAGLVSFILDSRDRGGGPAAPGRTGTIDTIVLEPDDITLGLSRQMTKAASLSIEVPTTRGARRSNSAWTVAVPRSNGCKGWGTDCSGPARSPFECSRYNGRGRARLTVRNALDCCRSPDEPTQKIRSVCARIGSGSVMTAVSAGRSFRSDGAGVQRADFRHYPNDPEDVPLSQHGAIQNRSGDVSFWPGRKPIVDLGGPGVQIS